MADYLGDNNWAMLYYSAAYCPSLLRCERSRPMSLDPQVCYLIPEETVRVARAGQARHDLHAHT